MNSLRLIFAQWRLRPWNTALSVLLLALGVAMLVFVWLANSQLTRQLTRDVEGIDLVVGAKGSPLQLILSAVYHLDVPTGNVPLATLESLRANPLVKKVIPVSIGDNYRGFRVVGTEPALIEHYGATLAQGAPWNGEFQAVLGATVARTTGLTPGAFFSGAHGLAAGGFVHEDAQYRVVGVLAPSGTVLDRLILTSLDSVWKVHEGEVSDDEERRILTAEREVTGLLVQYATPLAAVRLPREVNAASDSMAAVPAAELARLFALLGVGVDSLRALAGLWFGAAALALWVALANALEERRYDLAVLRLLGAGPARITWLLLLEAWLLAVVATLVGAGLGWAALQTVAAWLAAARGMALAPFAGTPELALIGLVPWLVATLATALPAWRAARMNLHETLADS